MATMRQFRIATWVLLTAALLSVRVEAQNDLEYTGVRIQLDNDLFAGRDQDRDYTGGFAVAISGSAARDGLLSLDPILARLDSLGGPQDPEVHYARQVGLMAFTPQDIVSREAQHDDRPYASLLFTSNGRVRVEPDNRTAWSSSLTIGVIGLSLTDRLQSVIHDVVGSEDPAGYSHQISAGGEPTARYTLARHSLWIANPNGTLDVKTTVQGSVGYLTETSAAISMRLGRFDSPWWSFTPELTDYIAAPTPSVSNKSRPEMYVFLGARVKARAYNAFLQGQFRDSAVTYSASELEPVLAEAWIGVVTQLMNQTQISYSLNYQTAEISHGPAARDALWGAVQLTHNF
jgi:hypothetical protein